MDYCNLDWIPMDWSIRSMSSMSIIGTLSNTKILKATGARLTVEKPQTGEQRTNYICYAMCVHITACVCRRKLIRHYLRIVSIYRAGRSCYDSQLFFLLLCRCWRNSCARITHWRYYYTTDHMTLHRQRCTCDEIKTIKVVTSFPAQLYKLSAVMFVIMQHNSKK